MIDRCYCQRVLAGLVGTLLYSCPVLTFAALEEVIVTAQKQEENIQTIPLAITAITGEQMEQKGITSFEGVAQTTPSISFSPFPNSSNTLILYMRAQGNSNPQPINSEGAVGLYEDGFLIARPNASTFDLADVERVEVLRGPQGTLYGRNTTGGAVNLISKPPTGEFGFKQSFSFATRNLFRSLTAINLPKTFGISSKISLLKSSVDGYVKNSGSGHDCGEQSQQAGRLLLHWDGMPNVAADYFFEKGDLNSTPIYYQNAAFEGLLIHGYRYDHAASPRSATFRPIDLDESRANFEGHGLTLTWDATDALTLKSLTGYRKLISRSFQDYADAFSSAPRTPLPYNSAGRLNTHQYSQELQLLGSVLDGAASYVLGAYYFNESGGQTEAANTPDYFLTQAGRQNAETKSKALFGQLSWTPDILDQRLELIAGARYTKDNRLAERFTAVTAPTPPSMAIITTQTENGRADGTLNNSTFSRFNPSFTAKYQWSENLNLYGKVTTGYRAGGAYSAAPIGKFAQAFAPENITNYELGMKSYAFEQRLRLNVAAFDSQYKDMQLTLASNPLNVSEYQVYNAGSAMIRGVEVELLAAPRQDIIVNIDYSYLNTSFERVDVIPGSIFDNSVNPASPYHVGDNIKKVFALPHAPKNSLNTGVNYTFLHFGSGDATASLNYRWQDLAYQTPAAGTAVPGRDFNAQKAYGLLDGRLTLALDLPRGDKAKMSVWGKNIARKYYQQQVVAQNGVAVPVQVGSSTVPAGYDSNTVAWSEPPSFGIDLSYQYY